MTNLETVGSKIVHLTEKIIAIRSSKIITIHYYCLRMSLKLTRNNVISRFSLKIEEKKKDVSLLAKP